MEKCIPYTKTVELSNADSLVEFESGLKRNDRKGPAMVGIPEKGTTKKGR